MFVWTVLVCLDQTIMKEGRKNEHLPLDLSASPQVIIFTGIQDKRQGDNLSAGWHRRFETWSGLLWFGCCTRLATCSANSAWFTPFQAESGRQWNNQNSVNPIQVLNLQCLSNNKLSHNFTSNSPWNVFLFPDAIRWSNQRTMLPLFSPSI